MSIEVTPLFKRILERTPFTERELIILVATAATRYKDHYIQKRNGRGQRLISQPTKEIKFLQRLLIKHELASLKVHESAVAYRPGRSTADHARPHAGNRYLLKLDFKDFFLSLHASALDHRLALDTEYTKTERWIICNLLCRRVPKTSILRLSIGAPSSPFISNYLMREFDERLLSFCTEFGVTYTRYADDLAFSCSTAHLLDRVYLKVGTVLDELTYLGIRLNSEKTVNVSTKRQRKLVGLVLANDGQVSVGRVEKRRLRAAVHAFANGHLSATDIGQLRGKLAYVYGFDPTFVMDLCKRHGIADLASLGLTAN